MVIAEDRPAAGSAEQKRATRWALITGASSGLGHVFAERLASKGFNVVLVARDEARLDAVALSLRMAYRVEAEVIAADLSEREGVTAVEDRLRRAPFIELLVNNAGFATNGRFHELPIEEEEREIRVNVLALVRLTHAALPGMLARKRGGIINVSSTAGFVTSSRGATYSATKAYATSFTQSLATDLHGSGVRLQALCPGYTHTEFQQRAGMEAGRIPRWLWDSPETVVDASLKALSRGTVVCVPTLKYRIGVWALRLLPRSAVRNADRFLRRR